MWLPATIAVLAIAQSHNGPLSPLLSWNIAWTAAALSAVAGTVSARRRAAAANRERWTLWACAASCWLVGQLAWNGFGLAGFPQSPNLADFAWWAFAVLVIISLIRNTAASWRLRLLAMLETLPLIGAAVAVTSADLWHDAARSTLAAGPTISALMYPVLYVTATVLMAQATISGSLAGLRSYTLPVTLAGMVAQAVAFSLWSTQLLAGTYVPGHTLLDPLWVVGLVAMGAGGQLAARRPEPVRELTEPERRAGVLPALVFAALAVNLIDVAIDRTPGNTGPVILLGSGLLLSGVSLVLRSFLLQRRLRAMLASQRRNLLRLADREEQLARANERLLEDSRRDSLTGMRNRRALNDDLPGIETRHREQNAAYAVALCDIDHFKAYNDRLGHLEGDQALRIIASTVRGALRSGDIAYRFGGEELLLIMPETTLSQAMNAAERIRDAVERAAVAHPAGIGGMLTVSIGLAAGAQEAATLLARADAALYEAKRDGRNRVAAGGAGNEIPAPGRAHSSAGDAMPRHLRSMLAVSRAAASGLGSGPVLDSLAATIRSELCFQVVAVRLRDRATESLRCVTVLGDEEARSQLLGSVVPLDEWQALIGSEHERQGAIWLPTGSYEWADESVLWVPETAAGIGPDAWDPDDMLMLPVRDGGGEILGIVSVDQPLNGRRPTDEELSTLMAVCDHAGLALAQVQRDSENQAAVGRRSSELLLGAVMLLAETLDLRDEGTARHSQTVGVYARDTALALGLDSDHVQRVHAAGVVHDLGKLGVADAILFKPSKLTDAEWREMKRHPEIGARILEHAGLSDISEWIRGHHERIDGHGYPAGLAGEEIALESRILAVADAYEAMIADRPYRAGMGADQARAELERCAGTQFDPEVVRAFLTTLDASDRAAGHGLDEVTLHTSSAVAGLVS
ncbi:MAG TPA: diguanylate cyclase [Solirubrobacteraceae bacterium]|nr:diguanylate cyclase [Solirubrobacteraceae bacterium]